MWPTDQTVCTTLAKKSISFRWSFSSYSLLQLWIHWHVSQLKNNFFLIQQLKKKKHCLLMVQRILLERTQTAADKTKIFSFYSPLLSSLFRQTVIDRAVVMVQCCKQRLLVYVYSIAGKLLNTPQLMHFIYLFIYFALQNVWKLYCIVCAIKWKPFEKKGENISMLRRSL